MASQKDREKLATREYESLSSNLELSRIVTGSRTIRSARATATTTPPKRLPEALLLIKSSLVTNKTFYPNKL
jgi:hypothetical protein